MTLRCVIAASLFLTGSLARTDDHKLESIKQGPKGLSPAIAKLVDVNGHRISGPDGPVIEIWLLKNVQVKSGFKPSFTQMYPFAPGQLIGAMRITEGVEYSDFKGQQMAAGTYTLRYGLQPQDGNHVGTSETYDFLLALPARGDLKTTPIKSFDELAEISAKAAGSTHPAIFSLLDPEEVDGKAKLEQDGFTEHWVLNFAGKARSSQKAVDLKVRLVVVGQSEG
ncbi:MAG: hypothetical protein VB858_17815 [Planctomycetaceae bacterium]